jgi:hypothetical protein
VTSNQSGTGFGHVTSVVVHTAGDYEKEARTLVGGLSGANPPAIFKIHIATP